MTVLDFYSSKCLTSTGGSNLHFSQKININLQIFQSKSLKRKKVFLTHPIICKLPYYYNQFLFFFSLPTQISCEHKTKQTKKLQTPLNSSSFGYIKLGQSFEITSLVSDWVGKVTYFPCFQLYEYLQGNLIVNVDVL